MRANIAALGRCSLARRLRARFTASRGLRHARRVEIHASVEQREQVWRPTLDDVQRISTGSAAKARGTGSRGVPHRLNADERKQFDLAKQKGMLSLAGSGYRRERKGSPLANIWRQWCDAKALPCVLLAKGAATDSVLVDLSTLRRSDVSQYREACRAIAQGHGVMPQAEAAPSPFTVILPLELVNALMHSDGGDSGSSPGGGDGSSSSSSRGAVPREGMASDAPLPVGVAAAPAVAAAEDAPCEAAPSSTGSSSGASSSSSDGDSGSSSSSSSSSDGGSSSSPVEQLLCELRRTAPIWQLPPQLQCFSADRATAKALAKQLAEELSKLEGR